MGLYGDTGKENGNYYFGKLPYMLSHGDIECFIGLGFKMFRVTGLRFQINVGFKASGLGLTYVSIPIFVAP